MDNQDQRRTHPPGHESHGVHLCHKCGWPFPNPHPSAKHRRAHKKICGTIEGYKRGVSEGQTHLHGSDEEHGSDDDHKTPGSKALDTGKNVKSNDGSEEKLIRSEEEVFSDAVADFLESGPSPGIKERLQEHSLDSGEVEKQVDIIQEKKIPGSSSEHNDLNAADVGQLIIKSSDDSQTKNPTILQNESIEMGNTVEMTARLSGSAMDPLSSSVRDLRTEELTIVHGDELTSESSDSHPSKAEAMPDVLPEENSFAGENVTESSLICVAKDSDFKGKDEIKSERDIVEIVDSSDNIVGETCEGVSEMAISDAVSLDHQVGDVAVNLKEKNDAAFLSLLPQNDLPLELITSNVQVEYANVLQFASSSDVKTLEEKGEGNVNSDPLPIQDDGLDVAHLQSEYRDFKDQEIVVLQDPLSLHSYMSLKHEEDELKEIVTEENDFDFSTSQLSEKSTVLSSDMHAMDSGMKMEQANNEPVIEDMLVEDCTEVSSVKLAVESVQISYEIGVSMNAMKTEMNENHVQFSDKQGLDDVGKSSQQISLHEGSLMASSNEGQMDTSFGPATSEITNVINIDNTSHPETKKNEINDGAVDDDKGLGANVENGIEIILKDHQPNDLLPSEIKPPSDLFKSDDAVEMCKIEQSEVTDTRCKEMPAVRDTSLPKSASGHMEIPVISDVLIDGPETKSNDEHNRSVGTSANSHESRDAELSVKTVKDLAREDTSLPSLNTEPSTQHDSAVEDNSGGEPVGGVSGITAAPVQDKNGNNLVKHSSSGIDASVYSSSRCDSLEGNWGSVSVLSMQSDAPAVIDAEISPSTGKLASTEAGKSNSDIPKAAASERQQSGKSEMFEPPSFMTLVESSHAVSPKGAASSEVQNPQQSDSTSQAGWFPSLSQVINESPGRKKNEEIIAKVTNWSTSKEHTPLKSLLVEATHINKPKSPKLEESSLSQKNGKVPGSNGSGLTTVNSILGPESPAALMAKEEAAKEWNSPARYPADIKRERRKFKSRPYWIQLVCCSTVESHRR